MNFFRFIKLAILPDILIIITKMITPLFFDVRHVVKSFLLKVITIPIGENVKFVTKP